MSVEPTNTVPFRGAHLRSACLVPKRYVAILGIKKCGRSTEVYTHDLRVTSQWREFHHPHYSERPAAAMSRLPRSLGATRSTGITAIATRGTVTHKLQNT